jgi:hypothetical protein
MMISYVVKDSTLNSGQSRVELNDLIVCQLSNVDSYDCVDGVIITMTISSLLRNRLSYCANIDMHEG